MALIRAGWEMRIRAHAMITPEARSATVAVPGKPQATTLVIELATEPFTPLVRFAVPRYVISGEPFDAPTVTPPHQPRGSWLSLFASQVCEIDDVLYARFLAHPDDAELLKEVDVAIGPAFFSRVRKAADLYGGMFLAQNPGSRAEWWHEAKAYWHGEHAFRRTQESETVETVNISAASLEDLGTYAAMMASCYQASSRKRNVIEVSSRLLLVAHGMIGGSNERFLSCFQAIEALSALATGLPKPDDHPTMQALTALLSQLPLVPNANRKQVLSSVRRLVANVPLRARFERLAAQYGGARAQEDSIEFARVNDARNDLIHGRTTEIPRVVEGTHLHKAVHDLAIRYQRAVVMATVREQPVQASFANPKP